MGLDINVHDQWAVESPGPIFDRSKEHLGSSDKGIITFRKTLIKAIKLISKGKKAPFIFQKRVAQKLHGPIAIDTISEINNWHNNWKEQGIKKRKLSNWADGNAI